MRVTASLWIQYPGILLGDCYNWHLYTYRLFCGYETPTAANRTTVAHMPLFFLHTRPPALLYVCLSPELPTTRAKQP
jgi:hypothetical protein